MFHGPSFSAGTITGAIIVFTMAYAPELLVNNSAKLSEVGGATKETEQIVEITFPQLLRESEVTTNTSTYQVAAIRKNTDPNSSSIPRTFSRICFCHFRGCSRPFGGYMEVILDAF